MIAIAFLLLSAIHCGTYLGTFEQSVETGTLHPYPRNRQPHHIQHVPSCTHRVLLPFATNKTSNLYSCALAISTLTQNYTDLGTYGRYSIIVKEGGSKTASGMSITLQTLIANMVVTIQVRYVIVESSFTYLDIVPFILNATSGSGISYPNYQTTLTPYPVSTSANLSQSNDEVMNVISGYDL
jgi:hypothetical protein